MLLIHHGLACTCSLSVSASLILSSTHTHTRTHKLFKYVVIRSADYGKGCWIFHIFCAGKLARRWSKQSLKACAGQPRTGSANTATGGRRMRLTVTTTDTPRSTPMTERQEHAGKDKCCVHYQINTFAALNHNPYWGSLKEVHSGKKKMYSGVKVYSEVCLMPDAWRAYDLHNYIFSPSSSDIWKCMR